MKINVSKEWIEQRASLEAGCEIGAGCPIIPGNEQDKSPKPIEQCHSEENSDL